MLDPHLFPIRLEFVRHYHRKRGADSRAHLRAMRHNDHPAIWLEAQIHAGMPGRIIRFVRGQRLNRQNARAEHQGSGREDIFQKTPATDYLDRVHAFTPAAILIAWRMRWYVPQRQMLPCIALSMS